MGSFPVEEEEEEEELICLASNLDTTVLCTTTRRNMVGRRRDHSTANGAPLAVDAPEVCACVCEREMKRVIDRGERKTIKSN